MLGSPGEREWIGVHRLAFELDESVATRVWDRPRVHAGKEDLGVGRCPSMTHRERRESADCESRDFALKRVRHRQRQATPRTIPGESVVPPPLDVRPRYGLARGAAKESQAKLDLGLEDLENPMGALFAIDRQPPQGGAAR